jgi:hypothetical protein
MNVIMIKQNNTNINLKNVQIRHFKYEYNFFTFVINPNIIIIVFIEKVKNIIICCPFLIQH